LAPIVNSDDQYETGDALMGRVNYNYNQRYFFTVTADVMDILHLDNKIQGLLSLPALFHGLSAMRTL
jgi:hypothetical protein